MAKFIVPKILLKYLLNVIHTGSGFRRGKLKNKTDYAAALHLLMALHPGKPLVINELGKHSQMIKKNNLEIFQGGSYLCASS